MQQELAATEFEGFDDDETVRVVFNGNQEPLTVDITDDAYQAGSSVSDWRVAAPECRNFFVLRADQIGVTIQKDLHGGVCRKDTCTELWPSLLLRSVPLFMHFPCRSSRQGLRLR